MERKWRWARELVAPAIDWEQKGDEWIDRVATHLSSKLRTTGYGVQRIGDFGPILEFSATTGSGGARTDVRILILSVLDGGMRVWLCGAEEDEDPAVSAIWEEAVEKAAEGVKGASKQHQWTALIGAIPTKYGGDVLRLAREVKVDSLSLSSTDRYCVETGLSGRSLSGWRYHTSIPILVRGVSSGYRWNEAQADAARELNRLASVLSIAWGVSVDVREGAASLDMGERVAPDLVPWLNKEWLEGSPDELPKLDVRVPSWVGNALRKVGVRANLNSAVSVYMEGCRLESDHQSMALVSFVAAIETVSLMIYKEDKCDECGGHTSIAAKFRQTLKMVLSETEVEALRPVYGSRSRTVHTGRLHGPEMLPGALSFSVFRETPEVDFEWRFLMPVKRAARELLSMALQGTLPKRTAFQAEPG
ncbi:hypothetical protein [Streptomyces hydrogenans]|uniref:hypothetical protein n=1 Tax=Streptomyces hydrogenans TaxID=1873719 RepID=UPI0033B26767